MSNTKTYKRLLRALSVALLCCFLLSLCQLNAACEDIGQQVLRLHILAHSDSEADQARKLLVRDSVLALTGGLFAEAENEAQAQQMAEQAMPAILAEAEKTLRENGAAECVRGEVCRMYFTSRQYETATLPAGYYTAVRLIIGEGRGHNWWCVLFPPLCTAAAESRPLSDVLDPQQQEIVEQPQRYEIRLRLLDWLTGKG